MRHPLLFALYLTLVLTLTIAAAITVSLLVPIHGAPAGLLITGVVAAVMLGGGLIGDKLHLAD